VTAEAYRKYNKLPEVGIDAVVCTFGNNPLCLSQKLDGEHNLCEYNNGKLIWANKYGSVREDITPLSQEMITAFTKAGITYIKMAGELYAVGPKGEQLFTNAVMSIIKAPTVDSEKQIMFGIFDIIEVRPFTDINLLKYYQKIMWMNTILGTEPTHVHTVFSKTGDVNVIKDLWESKVLAKDGWEGIIVRVGEAGEGSGFKVKKIGTIDVGIIGAYEGEGKNVGSMGSLVSVLMDKEGNLLHCGDPGTGFSDIERDEWWRFIQANKVGEIRGDQGRNIVLVKPIRVIEIGYSFIVTHLTRTFKWDGSTYIEQQPKVGGFFQTPRFYRIRDDKKFTPDDLRVEQVPLDAGGPPAVLTIEEQRKQALVSKLAKLKKRMEAMGNPYTREEKEQILVEEGIDPSDLSDEEIDFIIEDMLGENPSHIDGKLDVGYGSELEDFDSIRGELLRRGYVMIETEDGINFRKKSKALSVREIENPVADPINRLVNDVFTMVEKASWTDAKTKDELKKQLLLSKWKIVDEVFTTGRNRGWNNEAIKAELKVRLFDTKSENPYQKFMTQEVIKRLPPLYYNDKNKVPIEDVVLQVKFFTPDANWTWYGAEFDGKDTFFGYVKGHENEWGYFSLSELQSVRGPMGLKIERDMYFKPKKFSELTGLDNPALTYLCKIKDCGYISHTRRDAKDHVRYHYNHALLNLARREGLKDVVKDLTEPKSDSHFKYVKDGMVSRDGIKWHPIIYYFGFNTSETEVNRIQNLVDKEVKDMIVGDKRSFYEVK